MSPVDLVIAGAQGGTNVGESFRNSCRSLNLNVELVDTRAAYEGSWLLKRLSWHLLGHRPVRLERYSRTLEEVCGRLQPRWFLSVGIAPVSAGAIRQIRAQGIATFNFLTDDPFNPAHRGRWALESTLAYDTVFSPRRANMQDLRRLGCRDVRYLPFGFDPRHCHSEDAEGTDAAEGPDIIFVGGADSDRVPWVRALADAGFKVELYGSYWERFAATRAISRGQTSPDGIRRATMNAKIALCLVRRANRDGHVMRSLEIPAIGACMLVEDTEEHRELFGADGETVVYFQDAESMVDAARRLLTDEPLRARLASAVKARILSGGHTYADRLAAMLGLSGPSP